MNSNLSNKINILLVEDEIIIAFNQKNMLEKWGYNVNIVNNGENAIETVKQNPNIDLILMDINLGSGIDGTVTAEIILKEKDIPIVFLSSHSEPEIVEKTEKITSYGYVVKSSSVTVIDASIKMALKLYKARKISKESENKYFQLFQNNISSFALHQMIYDDNGKPVDYRFLDVNPAFERITQLKAKEILNKTVLEILPYTEKYWIDTYGEVVLSGNSVSFENYSKELNKYFEITAFKFNENQFACIFNDITERKTSEEVIHQQNEELKSTNEELILTNEKMEASNEELRITTEELESINKMYIEKAEDLKKEKIFLNIIINALNEPLYTIDVKNYEIIMANNIIGCENVGKKCYEVTHNSSKPCASAEHLCPIVEILKTKTSVVLEHIHYDENNNKRIVEVSAYPIFNKNNEVIQIVETSKDITDRRKAEEELKQSEEKYRFLTENISDVVWVLDLTEKRFTYVSPTVYNLRGYTPEEVLSQPLEKALTPKSAKKVEEKIKERLPKFLQNTSDAQLNYDEVEQPHKNGSIVQTETSTFYRINKQNNHIEILGVSRNITERKKAEEIIVNQNKELLIKNNAIENAINGIIFADLNRNIFYGNDSFMKMLGLKSKEEAYKNYINFFPESEHENLKVAENILKTKGYWQGELKVKKSSGELLDVLFSSSIITDVDNNPVGIMSSFIDITDRRRVQEKLLKSEAELKEAHNIARMGRWDLCHVTNKLKWTETIFDIFEINPDKFGATYEAFLETIHPDDRDKVNQSWINSLETKKPYKIDHRLLMKDGRIKWVTEHCHTEFEGNKPIHSIGIVQDITKRKKIEEKIKSLLSEKEKLLNETHHRIKNNMSVLRSILSIEASMQEQNPECKQVLNDCANRIMSMLTMYEYLYKNEIKKEMDISFYLKNLVDKFTEIYKHLSFKIEVNIQEIYLNPKIVSKIGIIINEFFTNSVKYAFQSDKELIISIFASKNEDTITIIFFDNGPGLPESFSFENAESFGLQLIYMLIQDIKGTINVEKNEGTKFIIVFNS